jgi:hypothetical protein
MPLQERVYRCFILQADRLGRLRAGELLSPATDYCSMPRNRHDFR